MMYICITGPRSVGKSTLAQSLAQTRRLSFHDTDVMADRVLARNGSSLTGEMKQRRYDRIYETILSGLHVALDDPNGSVIAAGWGCFYHPGLARLLSDRTLVVAVIPAIDPEQAAEALYPRERLRAHFDHLNDNDLMEICRLDARNGIALLAQHCHASLVVGNSDSGAIHNQLQALLERRYHIVSADAITARDTPNQHTALPYGRGT